MSETNKMNLKISEIKNESKSSKNSKKSPHQNDIYQPLSTDTSQKKISLYSKVLIAIELSFLIITFILAFRKAMQILLISNHPEIEEIQEKPTKKLIFKSSSNTSDICVCTFAKNQDRYINEFLQFYINLGVSKIFLYDNNDENKGKLDKIIKNNKTLVEILDWRGRPPEYEKMMDDCYKNNYNNYDWLIFYEIDEFIHLNNELDIKTFLSDKKFENCESVYLNWVYFTDNNLTFYDNRTLQERFPYKEQNIYENNTLIKHYVKSIIKGHGNYFDINNLYKLNEDIKGCDGKGNQPLFEGNEMKDKDFEDNYISKYYFKSTQEFVEKLKNENFDNDAKNESIYKYFFINDINEEKIKYIENKTKINLTNFRKNFNKYE
jgi:hypothetical protein